MRRLSYAPALLALSAIAGCNCGDRLGSQDPLVLPHQAGSFQVQVTSVTGLDGTPLTPGDGGSPDSGWPFPFSRVRFHVKGQALDENGNVYTDMNRVVAVRVTPGDIDPLTRTLYADAGYIEGDIEAAHVFGRVRLWVLDQPADHMYDDAGMDIVPNPADDPDAGDFSHAAGTSQDLYFQRPTLVDVQRQPDCDPSANFAPPVTFCNQDSDCTDQTFGTTYFCKVSEHLCLGPCDNRTSPLQGDFVEIDEPYTSDDAGMIVTGITSSGFYVTDLSAQKFSDPNDPTTPYWQGLTSTFGHIFVYTYQAPNDLYVGDHLISLTGSLEEFSGDTQLDFPGWVKVDQLPTPEFIPAPTPIDLTTCGSDATHPTATQMDLCGYYNDGLAGMSLESLESAPVVIDYATPSNIFVNCDYNGDGTLPLYANSKSHGGWYGFTDDVNYPEDACYIACTTGRPQVQIDGGTVDYSHYSDTVTGICSELSTLTTYGQWEVVMSDMLFPDGGVNVPSDGTRIGIQTADALPTFNPQQFALPQYQGVTMRVAGMLNQVQASRPRWLIYARDANDVCCHPVQYDDGGNSGCPAGLFPCTGGIAGGPQ
ncbi:MAG: hypothetical protein JST54_34820 [Deltaproteobacteria bacterium]|nr:hypothetical protein [Deltaproteobacteria bacterium]